MERKLILLSPNFFWIRMYERSLPRFAKFFGLTNLA